jgi:hypothetical protein
MAMEHQACEQLAVVAGSRELFAASTTKVAFQRGALLHAYAYRFVEIFAPHLASKHLRDAALSRLSLREPKAAAATASTAVPGYRSHVKVG